MIEEFEAWQVQYALNEIRQGIDNYNRVCYQKYLNECEHENRGKPTPPVKALYPKEVEINSCGIKFTVPFDN